MQLLPTASASFILLLLASSQGVLGQSPAPVPSEPAKGRVNGVFVLTAASCSFVNATTFALAGLPTSTEWVKFPPQPAAGALTQGRLTSEFLNAKDGQWAGRPQAALTGMYNGKLSHVLLQLDRPMYSAASNMMTFQYAVLAANNTDLPAVDGTVNDYAEQALQAGSGMQNSTLAAVTPGSSIFYGASLVMDIVGIQQYTTDVMARTEAGLIHVDLGENNYVYYP